MNSYINNLIEILYKAYNFKIIEIEENKVLYSKWALWTEENNIIKVIIFPSNEGHKYGNIKLITSKLEELFEYRDLQIIQIVLDKKTGSSEEYADNHKLGHEVDTS